MIRLYYKNLEYIVNNTNNINNFDYLYYYKMKIIDAFSFYNELDMLEYRLNVLNPYIDYFILVEATLTHKGKPKPLYYQENKERFKKFNHKIIHIIDEELKTEKEILEDENYYIGMQNRTNKVWYNEIHQRNSIDRGIKQLNLNSFDLIIIADLDEIPDPQTIASIKYDNIYEIRWATLEMDLYYFNLTYKNMEKWHYAKLISFDSYNTIYACTPDKVRMLLDKNAIIKNGGWHLSYFGDPKFIQNKLQNFGHQEYNTEKYTNLQYIEEKMNSCHDFFDRKWEAWTKIPIANNKYLPWNYHIHLKKFITDFSLAY